MFILLNLYRVAFIHPDFHLPPLGRIVATVVASAQFAFHGNAFTFQSTQSFCHVASCSKRHRLRFLTGGTGGPQRGSGNTYNGNNGKCSIRGPALPDLGQNTV